MKLNNTLKEKLEAIFKIQGFALRYEKGNFKSGWCLLDNNEVVVINKFLPVESKVGALIEILRQVAINEEILTEKQRKLIHKIKQTELDF